MEPSHKASTTTSGTSRSSPQWEWEDSDFNPSPTVPADESQFVSEDTSDSGMGRRKSLKEQKVERQMFAVEHIIREAVERRDILNNFGGRKRKASAAPADDEPSILDPETTARLREYLLAQARDSSGEDDESSDPEFQFTDDKSLVQRQSPTFSASTSLADMQFEMPELPAFWTQLPSPVLDTAASSFAGWSPTTQQVSPPRAANMERPSDQKLMQAYLTISAPRLADSSPSYIDLFRKYIPAMAQESPALMNAILAIGALHLGLQQKDQSIIDVESVSHYHLALAAFAKALAEPDITKKEGPLATTIIMSHYEIWMGENVKMGVHMLGGRDLILARGKQAHVTPIGRALFAAFRRLDVSSSSISGNPSFFTNDWWTVDPYSHVPIPKDAPTLLVADAAFAKLTLICDQLTHTKFWAMEKRRKLRAKQQKNETTDDSGHEEREKMQESIAKRVKKLENSMNEWQKELPDWFAPLQDDPTTGPDNTEEDINSTQIREIIPRKYPHKSVAVCYSYAWGLRLQLFRLEFPDVPCVDKERGSYCHAILRAFAGLPSSTDSAMSVPLFTTGMELRQTHHQQWFHQRLQERIDETGFHLMKFLKDATRWAWMKMEGRNAGRFIRIKEGAASKIEGVSENLWSAEGILGSLEALSLYETGSRSREQEGEEDPDMKPRNYSGDFKGIPNDEAPAFEVAASLDPDDPRVQALAESQRSNEERKKRYRSHSPEPDKWTSVAPS